MPTPRLPEITIGTRLTDFGTFDLTVKGFAQGGMGLVVWGPDQANGGQWRAAKLVRPDRANNQSLRDAFEHEALVWCRLWTHQAIITAESLTRLPGWGDLPVLVLEYAPRGTLRQALQRVHQPGQVLTLEAAFAWGQHVAAALAHLHAPDLRHERPAPLVHADLKPENLLLDVRGWANLTDLGLSRVWAQTSDAPAAPPLEAAPSDRVARMIAGLQAGLASPGGQAAPTLMGENWAMLTRTRRFTPAPGAGRPERGAVVGTVPYMGPEQWEGIEAVVPGSDVYALGVVLYELFAGRPGWPHEPTLPGSEGWREAHKRDPRWRLTNVEVGALENGPLWSLVDRGGAAGRAEAERVLGQLADLVAACLEREASARPRAEEVQRVLGDLAEQVGLKRQQVMPLGETTENEVAYWNNLGNTVGNLGRLEEQLRLFERARELAPQDPRLWSQVGAALRQLGRLEEALEAYAEAERRVPESEREALTAFLKRLAYNRGNALFKLERYAEAVAAYRQSLKLVPGDASAWHNLAHAYRAWSKDAGLSVEERVALLEEALKSLERVLTIDQNDSRVPGLRPLILADLQRLQQGQGRSGALRADGAE